MNRISYFQSTPRIVMGVGSIERAAEEAKSLGGRRIMIITDPGLVKAGLVNRLEEILTKGGLSVTRFDEVEADPSYETTVKAADRVKQADADMLIGLGGGSSLDVTKVSSILATNEGPVTKYFGLDQVPSPGLKTILIPTTAGTGSEATPIAILSDHGEKMKKAIFTRYLFPATAILDPELTLGLPPQVTAATGMDALIHAIEAFTSVNATSMTDLLAQRAMEMIFNSIRTAYAKGQDIAARSTMLEGSLLAGIAFANAGVTVVHAFAYPIGAEFHIPHGLANSIMLVPVMEFNLLGNLPKFARMAELFGVKTAGMTSREAAFQMVESMRLLSSDLKVDARLSDFGVKGADIPELAAGVMKVTRLLANNPRELRLEDAKAIYQKVL